MRLGDAAASSAVLLSPPYAMVASGSKIHHPILHIHLRLLARERPPG
jgi:hypothetical protein